MTTRASVAVLGVAAFVACSGNDLDGPRRCGEGTIQDGQVCYGDGTDGGQSPSEPATGGAEGPGDATGVGGSGSGAGATGAAEPDGGGSPSTAAGGMPGGQGGERLGAGGDGGQGGGAAAGETQDGGSGEGGTAGEASSCNAATEVCGNQADENCDGFEDEGCSCAIVAASSPGSLPLPGAIMKLQPDPQRCLAYAVTTTDPAELLVIDTGEKVVLDRVRLSGRAIDFDVAASGEYLVVLGEEDVAWTIDGVSRRVTRSSYLLGEANAIEAASEGMAYYVAGAASSQAGGLFSLNVLTGASAEAGSRAWHDIELSTDEQKLFAISHGSLERLDRVGSVWKQTEFNSWMAYGDSTNLYLPPSGMDVYGGVQRFYTDQFSSLLGRYPEDILAQDAAGSFEVGQRHVFDARTSRQLGTLPHEAIVAALVNDDRELWYFSAATGRLHFANVHDVIDDAELGVRVRPAKSLGYYALSRLIADPKRERLYGLDPVRQVVVVIDLTTLEALDEIAVGLLPTAFTLTDDADFLMVSHDGTSALSRIELDTGAFEAIDTAMLSRDIAALSNGRVAISGADAFFRSPILDGATGEVLEELPSQLWGNILSPANAGASLFVVSNSSPRRIEHYDMTTSPATRLSYEDSSDQGADWAVAVPDASALFVSNGLLDGADLTTKLYDVPMRVYDVTPNSAFALTYDSVLRVSDGSFVGLLEHAGTVRAVSADGETLFVLTGQGIKRVSLAEF